MNTDRNSSDQAPVAYDISGRPLYAKPPEPAAYDPDGRPLYYADEDSAANGAPVVSTRPEPQPSKEAAKFSNPSHVTRQPESLEGQNFNPRLRSQYANEPKVVHAPRPMDPAKPNISDELMAKYRASSDRYPFLNLSEGEYVILDIKRHPIGMLIPISITTLLVAGIISFAVFYPAIVNSTPLAMPSIGTVVVIALLLAFIVTLGGAAALWVYLQNQFFMTNESVIQEIQESLFSRHEQTVSLGSIEDASFRQKGIIQIIFNYGTIRLSTEGEETTYIFHFVTNPKRQIARLNNAIEAFKNGRPVCDD
ncbi:hypothetical protein CR969_00675 [Candidatus Saccharibacteria bacterium]|nr:MAG: hypothetical protein CR969_00675 [Candidatus Saccharibacteria bacterium]